MTVDASRLRKVVHRVYPGVRALRRDLHAHPETAFNEKRTAREIVRHLRKLDIPCHTGIGRTGVVAHLEGKHPGPCVALRADMDALPIAEENRCRWKSKNPGRMHACGHDGHTANLVGVAHVLATLRDELAGTVKFIFQPAEEAGIQGGAALMIADGALDDPTPEVIFGLHTNHAYPQGSIAIAEGPALASADFFDIRIRGVGSHAAYPHRGIDPIVVAGAITQALQTIVSRRVDPLEPVVVTIGKIHGGTAPNIIPDEVTLSGTTRSYSAKVRRLVRREVERIPKAVARAMGATAEVNYLDCYPAVINDRKPAAFVREVATDLLGKKDCIEAAPSMGGEDFAFYLERVSGALFWLGNGRPERRIHTPHFDFNDEALKTGMLVMSELVLRWPQKR